MNAKKGKIKVLCLKKREKEGRVMFRHVRNVLKMKKYFYGIGGLGKKS